MLRVCACGACGIVLRLEEGAHKVVDYVEVVVDDVATGHDILAIDQRI